MQYKTSSGDDAKVEPPKQDTNEKRIKVLEAKVSRLMEELGRIRAMVQQSNRSVRRQTSDINNISTTLSNRK